MRVYIKIIICGWLAAAASGAWGQEIEFVSSEVEAGIRKHLGFNDEDPIGFVQLDTITTLDLSRRGITDVHDLVLMPKLRSLDLSDNQVEDLQPLTVLEELEWLDLSYNGLKGINDLCYSSAKNLTINVAFNYIKDFSFISSITSCDFTLEGTRFQMLENAPFVDIYHFYADIDDDDQPIVTYSCSTNLETEFYFEYGETKKSALTDGSTNTVDIPFDIDGIKKVVLTNGEIGDTTYVVPPADYMVGAGETVTLETGLPEDYHLYSAYASKGSIEIEGTTMKYTAPETAVADIIYFSYYQEAVLRGFSRFYVNKDIKGDVKGDVNGDGEITAQDASLVLQLVAKKIEPTADGVKYDAADVNGDGDVTAQDASLILQYVAKKITW